MYIRVVLNKLAQHILHKFSITVKYDESSLNKVYYFLFLYYILKVIWTFNPVLQT